MWPGSALPCPDPASLPARAVCTGTKRVFVAWTLLLWGLVGVLAVAFFAGAVSFTASTKAGLYAISVWLNGWMIPLLMAAGTGGPSSGSSSRGGSRPRADVWHECLVLWSVSYLMTNLLWEIPWLLGSPFAFSGVNTLGDVVAQTPWLRESAGHMWWWVLASFASVDLRTVNGNSTFYTLELYAFVNVATQIYFLRLNRRRSPYRYLVPVVAAGEPVAATFIFSVSEALAGFPNMAGGTADTLLALVWTQYQYFLFPLIFAGVSSWLLLEDWAVHGATAVGHRGAGDSAADDERTPGAQLLKR